MQYMLYKFSLFVVYVSRCLIFESVHSINFTPTPNQAFICLFACLIQAFKTHIDFSKQPTVCLMLISVTAAQDALGCASRGIRCVQNLAFPRKVV